MSLCKEVLLLCLTFFFWYGTYLFAIGWFYYCLNLIGRGTGARSCVVNVERSLVGGPSVMVDLHCVSSQISLFECFKPVLLSQGVVHSV